MSDHGERERRRTQTSENSADSRPNKPLGITVNVTAAVASMVTVIALDQGKSEAAVIREAITVLVNEPREPRDRDAEFKAKLAAAAKGQIQKKPTGKEAQFTERLSSYLDADLHAALIDYCREERSNKARAVRKAVDNYVWEEVRKAGLADLPQAVDLTSTGVGRKPK